MFNYKIHTLKHEILKHGKCVTVRNISTIELAGVYLEFKLKKNIFIPAKHVLVNENVCYRDVAKGFAKIRKKLEFDISTRKAVFISRHCISFVQVLCRNNTMIAFVVFRSSNIDKLETDLHIIAKELLKLSKAFKQNKIILSVNVCSAHIIKDDKYARCEY